MELGREQSELLERGVRALEKMASDPVVEIEAGPPLCPNCGALNPEVKIPEHPQERGRLGEFILQAVCMECDTTIYAVIESYSMHRTLESVAEEIEARKGGDNGKVV